MTTFYFIRHGTNEYLGKAIAGRQNSVRLNAAGRDEAEKLADRLSSEPITRIVSSPLARCRETAEPLARRLGLEVEFSEKLNELDFGDWTDRTLEFLQGQPEWALWNSARSHTRMPNGEMMIEVQTRVVTEVHRLRLAHADETIALVTHGDVIRAALLYFLGAPLDFVHRLEISPASISALRLDAQTAQVLYLNRCGA